MYNTSLHYGPYVYPRWGKGLGVCMGAISCLQIPIWAIVAISKETGTLKEVSTITLSFCLCEVQLHLWHASCMKLLLTVYCIYLGSLVLFCFQRFQKTIRPLNSWRVNNVNNSARMHEQMEPERIEAPFTVTLTDMDYNTLMWEVGSQAWWPGRTAQWWGIPEEEDFILFVPAWLWWPDSVLQANV